MVKAQVSLRQAQGRSFDSAQDDLYRVGEIAKVPESSLSSEVSKPQGISTYKLDPPTYAGMIHKAFVEITIWLMAVDFLLAPIQ